MDEITSNKEYRKFLYQVCEKAEGGTQPTAEEMAVLQRGDFEKVGHVVHGIFVPYEGWRTRLQGAKCRRAVTPAFGKEREKEPPEMRKARQKRQRKP